MNLIINPFTDLFIYRNILVNNLEVSYKDGILHVKIGKKESNKKLS